MEQRYITTGSSYIPAQVQLVTDSTGQYAFSPESLPEAYTYDGNAVLQTETRGPDAAGNSFKKTYTFNASTGKLQSATAWVKLP